MQVRILFLPSNFFYFYAFLQNLGNVSKAPLLLVSSGQHLLYMVEIYRSVVTISKLLYYSGMLWELFIFDTECKYLATTFGSYFSYPHRPKCDDAQFC